MRRHLRASAALCAATVAIVFAGSANAVAETTHVFDSSFSVPQEVRGVAVDDSTGLIYALGTNGSIYKYTAVGAPSNFSSVGSNALVAGCAAACRTIAVDNSGGANQGVIYVGTSTAAEAGRGVLVFLPNGRPGSRISNGSNAAAACGVTVSRSGTLYVMRAGNNIVSPPTISVDTYKPELIVPDPFPAQVWPLRATIKNIGEILPCRIAVDTNFHMYISSSTSAVNPAPVDVFRYTVDPFSNAEAGATLFDKASNGFAVDHSTDDFYSNHVTSITRIDSSGDARETFGQGKLAASGALAVNGTNGVVYAANRTAKTVQVFSTVTTPDIDSVSAEADQTTADLSATVDTAAAGDVTACEFEYGTTTAYGSTAGCGSALPYSSETDTSASLGSLEKETTYHYRLRATNANGSTLSPDRTFTTHNVANVTSDLPSNVTQSGATLNGSFEGNGDATTYYFEWGSDTSYGNTTPVEPAGAPTGETTISAPITGLSVYLPESSPYHFRLVATNSSGTTVGPDREFTSAPPDPPGISGVAVRDLTETGFVVDAQLNPGNGPTVYWVEYGLSPQYELGTVPDASIGDDATDHPVSTSLGGLTPGQTYHFRIVAANFGGTSHSEDHVVNVPAKPGVDSLLASGITETTATLSGTVSAGFRPTSYHFEYGLTSAYGSATSQLGRSGASAEPEQVSAGIGGLKAGVAYHYRLVASNDLGTVQSPDATFTTVAPPPPAKPKRPAPRLRCKKGFVKKHGKCVRKKPKHRQNKKKHKQKQKKGTHR